MIQGYEWLIVILVVALIFGASRLPLLGRNLGQGIKEFKKGVNEAKSDKRKPEIDQPRDAGLDGSQPGSDRIPDRRD